jgi:hypothetical protein
MIICFKLPASIELPFAFYLPLPSSQTLTFFIKKSRGVQDPSTLQFLYVS